MANAALTGFLQGFTGTSLQLLQLHEAKRRHDEQQALQKEQLRILRDRAKGQQAEFELRQAQALQKLLQPQRLGAPGDVFQLPTGEIQQLGEKSDKLSVDQQVFRALQSELGSPTAAFSELMRLKQKPQRFGAEREALASSMFAGQSFEALTPAQQEQINQRIVQQRIDISAAQKAEAPIPSEIAVRLASADAGVHVANDIFQLFSPTFTGPLTGRAGSIKQILGMTEDQEDQLRQSTLVLAEMVIRSRTGAQASEAELVRSLKQMPSLNDQPTVFLNKLKAVTRQLLGQREAVTRAVRATRGQGGPPAPKPLFEIEVPTGERTPAGRVTGEPRQQTPPGGFTIKGIREK